MRIIQKTISLEPMTSRLPSVWPAYKNNKLYYFDDASLKEREYEYPSNYGMIPLSIAFTHSFSSNSYSIGCGGDTLSFERMSKMYGFFKRYNYLLNKAGHCGRTYSSATEYYDVESNSRYIDFLEYGMDRETYVELDETYENYGGSGFCEWLGENAIPTYTIMKEYKEYWNRDVLYYPDVIRWIAWLNERTHYESEAEFQEATEDDIEHWDCKKTDDCCDCEEYFHRGGNRILEDMKKWYNGIQPTIIDNNNTISGETTFSCFTPSMIEHIELQNSLDDIGQYSILSPQYELGIDYRGAEDYSSSSNTKSGTTVIISGDTMILQPDKSGFCFSPYYMEKVYDESAWSSYTMVYINDNPQEFVSNAYSAYAFDNEDRMYVGSDSGDVISHMSSGETYPITSGDFILIDNTLIPIEKSEYGVYDPQNKYLGGRTFFVEREKGTTTPFTIINGQKFYAETKLNPNGGIIYYFPFFKDKEFGRTVDTNSAITYILYDGQTYEVTGDSITINGIEYPKVSGYAYDKFGNIIYVINNQLYDSDVYEIPSSSATINDGVIWVNVYDENETVIYNATELTGRTISKILSLALTNTLVDDVGKSINGIYEVPDSVQQRRVNHQPPAETELEPLYQVNNTSLIGKFKLTSGNTDLDYNYFIGNIITNMTFYYKTLDGERVERTVSACTCDNGVSSLKAIQDSTNEKGKIEREDSNTVIFDDDIYCDIKYYIGATLKRKSGQTKYTLADGYNYGVEYNETVKFVRTPVQYQLKAQTNRVVLPTEENNPSGHTVGYVIYTYELEQILEDVGNNIYGSIYKAPLADFKTEINLIGDNSKTNFSKYDDMSAYNGINVSPVFKEEYKLGLAAMEKVDSNIYIDRGMNAAFEKHLKLGEVVSMEALLNYTNGYFKIMNN